jgi:hypothetical protein
MEAPRTHPALSWIPLLVLGAAHGFLFRSCLSELLPLQGSEKCSSPPLSTLGLLALAFVELTRGSRTRGAIALGVIAIPHLLRIVGDVIN